MQTKINNPKFITVSTNPETKAKVMEMANDERRSISNIINLLIEQEYTRRHPENK